MSNDKKLRKELNSTHPTIGEIEDIYMRHLFGGVLTSTELRERFRRALEAHDAEITAKADLAGFNRGYEQADREWRRAGDGRGMV